MKWKEAQDALKPKDDTPPDTFEEEDYPLWEKPKKFSLSQKIEIPFVLMACGLIALIVLSLLSFFGKSSGVEPARIETLENRFAALEERFIKVEEIGANLTQPSASSDAVGKLQTRLTQLESSISQRMDQIAMEVANLNKKTSAVKTEGPVLPKAASPPPAKPAEKKYHQVRAGDTLYSISREYDVTLEDLRRLNNISSGSTIYPGQKLVVGP